MGILPAPLSFLSSSHTKNKNIILAWSSEQPLSSPSHILNYRNIIFYIPKSKIIYISETKIQKIIFQII